MKIEVLGNTLDKEQTKAALTNDTNSIIIAGAGSGKSLTMVGKIKYLVTIKNININDILCITFTNNAAKSLENKMFLALFSCYEYLQLTTVLCCLTILAHLINC